MGMLNNYVRSRKQVKADRATEQGIAGHTAAMNALNPKKGLKGIPVGISYEAAAALQNPNYERSFRGNHTTDEDTK